MISLLQSFAAPHRGTVMRASQRSFATAAHSRMPTQKDYYSILGVDSDATPE